MPMRARAGSSPHRRAVSRRAPRPTSSTSARGSGCEGKPVANNVTSTDASVPSPADAALADPNAVRHEIAVLKKNRLSAAIPCVVRACAFLEGADMAASPPSRGAPRRRRGFWGGGRPIYSCVNSRASCRRWSRFDRPARLVRPLGIDDYGRSSSRGARPEEEEAVHPPSRSTARFDPHHVLSSLAHGR